MTANSFDEGVLLGLLLGGSGGGTGNKPVIKPLTVILETDASIFYRVIGQCGSGYWAALYSP